MTVHFHVHSAFVDSTGFLFEAVRCCVLHVGLHGIDITTSCLVCTGGLAFLREQVVKRATKRSVMLYLPREMTRVSIILDHEARNNNILGHLAR